MRKLVGALAFTCLCLASAFTGETLAQVQKNATCVNTACADHVGPAQGDTCPDCDISQASGSLRACNDAIPFGNCNALRADNPACHGTCVVAGTSCIVTFALCQ
jgi:hypothetical protein